MTNVTASRLGAANAAAANYTQANALLKSLLVKFSLHLRN